MMPPNLLSVILLLVGAKPFHETCRGSRWRKINPIGLLFCIGQLAITTLGFTKERERSGATGYYKNNIIVVTVVYKQFLTLLLPFLYVIGKLLRIRQLELFHVKTAQFDRAICRESWNYRFNFPEAVQKLKESSRRLSFLAGLSLCFGEVGIIYIGAVYSIRTTDTTPKADLFYFYQVTILIYLGCGFYNGILLNDLQKRMQLLVEMEKSIVEDIIVKEGETERKLHSVLL